MMVEAVKGAVEFSIPAIGKRFVIIGTGGGATKPAKAFILP